MTTKNNRKSGRKPMGIVLVEDDRYPTVYVNHAQIAFSVFDAAIMIGEIREADPEANNLHVVPRAKLVMSHQFIHEFARLISANLKLFEEDKDLNPLAKMKIVHPPDRES